MKTSSKRITSLAAGCLTTLGLVLTPQAAVAGEVLAAPATGAANPAGASQFQVILQKNIFDPERGTGAPIQESTPKRPSRIETFSFRGSAEKLGKGFDAFFDGDGAPVSGAVDVNEEINGFKVQEIGLSEVKLLGANHEVVILKDQTGLTRRDGGPWIKVSVPVSYSPAAPNDNAGADGGGPGRASAGFAAVSTPQTDTPGPAASNNADALARLQARRAQED